MSERQDSEPCELSGRRHLKTVALSLVVSSATILAYSLTGPKNTSPVYMASVAHLVLGTMLFLYIHLQDADVSMWRRVTFRYRIGTFCVIVWLLSWVIPLLLTTRLNSPIMIDDRAYLTGKGAPIEISRETYEYILYCQSVLIASASFTANWFALVRGRLEIQP